MRVADYMAVWVGVVDLTDRNQGQVIDVAHVVMHPDYDPDTAENNVALLRLAAPAQLSATVQPVRLATATDLDLYRPGTLGAVTGWGSTDSYFGPKVDVLHGASVSIVDQNVCDAVYAELLDVPDVVGVPDAIFDSEICAGLPEGGKGPCKGDGGSPLVVPDGHGGWVQVGIASWGGISEDFSCAPAGIPAVFTRVPGIVDWLMGPAQFTYHGPEVFSVSDGSGRPGRSASGYGSHVSTIVGQLEQVIEVFLPAVLK